VSGCPRNCAEATCKDIGVVCVDSGYEISIGGAAGLHVKQTELLTKVATEEEAIWAICAVMQLYREGGWYLERIYKWMGRVGLESIRAEIEDPERRRQLYDLFAYSQRFARIDPWAERVAGRHADEFNPLSRRMELATA
jgi:nitrite reductase (NADH) large subunit